MPATGLFLSTVQVVILPIVGGLLLKRWLPGVMRAILPGAPLVAVLMITLGIGTCG